MSAYQAFIAIAVVFVALVLLKATFFPSWRKFAREARAQGARTYTQLGPAVFFFREADGGLECAHAEAGLRETAFAWAGDSQKIEWKPSQPYLIKNRKSLKWVL